MLENGLVSTVIDRTIPGPDRPDELAIRYKVTVLVVTINESS
jgi:hypothetical protein